MTDYDPPGSRCAIAIVTNGTEADLDLLPLALRALRHTGTESPVHVICPHYQARAVAAHICPDRHRLMAVEIPRPVWPQHARGLLMSEAARIGPEHGWLICATARTLFLLDPAILATELDIRAGALQDIGYLPPCLAMPYLPAPIISAEGELRAHQDDRLLCVRRRSIHEDYARAWEALGQDIQRLPYATMAAWRRVIAQQGCIEVDASEWHRDMDHPIDEDTAAIRVPRAEDTSRAWLLLDEILSGALP